MGCAGDGTIHRVRLGGRWYNDCSRLGRGFANIGKVVHLATFATLLVICLTVVLATLRAAVTLVFATAKPADVLFWFLLLTRVKLLI